MAKPAEFNLSILMVTRSQHIDTVNDDIAAKKYIEYQLLDKIKTNL